MADSLVTLTALVNEPPASVIDRVVTPHKGNMSTLVASLGNLLNSFQTKGGKINLRVDSVTKASATLTVTCTQASFTANDKLIIQVPGIGNPIILTAKTSGAVAASGEFDAITNDNTTAANLNTAIGAYPLAKQFITSTVSTNVVTITYAVPGSGGNSVVARVSVGGGTPMALSNSGSFTGGQDGLVQASVTNTITQASLVSGTDTCVIGNVTLTWQSSPSGENQVLLDTTDTLCAAALVSKINAHSKLGKLFVATNAAGVVTITFKGDPRLGSIIAITEAGNGQVLSAASFAPTATLASSGDSVAVSSGA